MTSCLPPTPGAHSPCVPCWPREPAWQVALGRDSDLYTWGGVPSHTSEELFVLKHIQFINNEIEAGIYLFMIAFKSPIRSYIYFSCQFSKNLLKFLLM